MEGFNMHNLFFSPAAADIIGEIVIGGLLAIFALRYFLSWEMRYEIMIRVAKMLKHIRWWPIQKFVKYIYANNPYEIHRHGQMHHQWWSHG